MTVALSPLRRWSKVARNLEKLGLMLSISRQKHSFGLILKYVDLHLEESVRMIASTKELHEVDCLFVLALRHFECDFRRNTSNFVKSSNLITSTIIIPALSDADGRYLSSSHNQT